jgi:hypothetical protein
MTNAQAALIAAASQYQPNADYLCDNVHVVSEDTWALAALHLEWLNDQDQADEMRAQDGPAG